MNFPVSAKRGLILKIRLEFIASAASGRAAKEQKGNKDVPHSEIHPYC
jgi:hypothetical protein